MATEENAPGEWLHTKLSLVDAAAFSVGLIGPVGAMACWERGQR